MAKRNITDFTSKYWNNLDFKDSGAADIVAWKIARSAIEHENSLVNHRMTWLLQSQAFLFAAFALIFTKTIENTLTSSLFIYSMLILTTLFGAFAAYITRIGLGRAHTALTDITLQYENLIDKNKADPIVPPLHLWEDSKLFSEEGLPDLAIAIWSILLIMCITHLLNTLPPTTTTTVITLLVGIAIGTAFTLILQKIYQTKPSKANTQPPKQT